MGDWFIAVGTGTACSNTVTEKVAIRASANSEIALLTAGTLIYNRVWPGRYGFYSLVYMANSVAGLFTGRATEPATAR